MNRISWAAVIALIAVLLALVTVPASGAEGNTAYLFSLDSTQFPQISAYLSVSDPLGGRTQELTVVDISLKEDNAPARNVILTEEQTGVRLVAVLDPGLDMVYALPDGETRIDRVRRAMTDWLENLPQGGIDDLTLVTPEDRTVSHTSDAKLFLDGLRAYTPKVPAERTLDSMLVDAFDAADDQPPHPGMRALVIVFSASKLSQSEGIGQGLCPRARELHAPVYGIWSGRTEPSTKQDVEALAALAAECGGYSAALESPAATAALLGMIATQRTQYRVEYRSAASLSGEHSIAAAVSRGNFQAETPRLPFQLEIQPPAVAWIDFPDRLTRQGSEISQPVESYLPDAVDLQANITFPDGHPRGIVSMQLFANYELAGECAAFPCAGVRWDLRKYAESGKITLQITVRDELGLEGQSAQRQLALEVLRPAFWEIFRAYYLLPVTILMAVAAAAGFVIAVVVNLNRVRAAQAAGELLFPGGRSAPAAQVATWKDRLAGIARRRLARPAPPAESYAVLEGIGGEGRRIDVAAEDVIIGGDPRSAAIVLDDPSVSPRHARIVRMGDGTPWVFDLGSAAGSWKNFEEVPPEGASLREGDRLNFGRAAFRVRLKPFVRAEENLHEK